MHLSCSVHEGHVLLPFLSRCILLPATTLPGPPQTDQSLMTCTDPKYHFAVLQSWFSLPVLPVMPQALLHCRSPPCTREVLASLPNSLPLGSNECITSHLLKAEEFDSLFISPYDPDPSAILLKTSFSAPMWRNMRDNKTPEQKAFGFGEHLVFLQVVFGYQ